MEAEHRLQGFAGLEALRSRVDRDIAGARAVATRTAKLDVLEPRAMPEPSSISSPRPAPPSREDSRSQLASAQMRARPGLRPPSARSPVPEAQATRVGDRRLAQVGRLLAIAIMLTVGVAFIVRALA